MFLTYRGGVLSQALNKPVAAGPQPVRSTPPPRDWQAALDQDRAAAADNAEDFTRYTLVFQDETLKFNSQTIENQLLLLTDIIQKSVRNFYWKVVCFAFLCMYSARVECFFLGVKLSDVFGLS